MTSAREVEATKYRELGAYHWRDIGRHWIYHNAYTAERYQLAVLEKETR